MFTRRFLENAPVGADGVTNANILARYGKGEEPDRQGTVRYSSFMLFGQGFGAMDSAWEHQFGFNDSLFIVPYENERNRLWF